MIPRQRRVQFRNDDIPPLVQTPPAIFPPPCMVTPSPQAGSQHINPDLCSPRGNFPYIDWDLTQFPSTARRCISQHSHETPAFDGPAIFPPTQLITISYADAPALMHWEKQWGPIFARGQGLHPATVENVLDAIHHYFNQPLTHADHASMTGHTWGITCDAYYRRLPRSPNLGAYDAHRGALRVDVLNGATKFSGLQCVGHNYLRLTLSA